MPAACDGGATFRPMPYDEDLVNRLRAELADHYDAVTEKRMFGGLAFLLHGHLCVAASHSGGLLARIDPESSAALLDAPRVERMVMNGREMAGWLRVAPEVIGTDAQLAAWVERCVAFVQTLPPKR